MDIKSTTDYAQFTFLHNNRDADRAHIERLKKVFEDKGELSKLDPILVNERKQIIDGQHRFIASEELHQPVYYREVAGLTIDDARKMNINRKNWSVDDYAHSYANGGNKSYQNYLTLREDYPGVKHSVFMAFIEGTRTNGAHKRFRNGDLVLSGEAMKTVSGKIDLLMSLEPYVGKLVNREVFAKAFIKIMSNDKYDHQRMLGKISKPTIYENFKQYVYIADHLRQLEDTFNHGMSEENRVRLF